MRHSRFHAVAAPVAAGAILLAGGAPLGAAEFRLSVDGTIGARGDGNFEQSAERDDRADLGLASLTLGLDVVKPKVELGLAYTPTFQRELSGAERDSTQHALGLGLDAQVGQRTRLSLSERLRQTDQMDLGFVVSPDSLAVARRGDQLHHSFQAELSRNATRRMVWTARAGHSRIDYDGAELPDTDTIGGSAGLHFDLSRARRIGLSAGARRSDVSTLGEGTSVFGTAEYERQLGRFVRVSLGAGGYSAEVPDPATGEQVEATGFRGHAGLHGSNRKVGWNVEWRRDVGADSGVGRFTESDRWLAAVNGALGRRVRVGLAGYYNQDQAITGPESLDLLAVNLSTSLRLGRVVTLALSASWIDQSSTFPGFDDLGFARYSVGLRFPIFRRGDQGLDASPTADEPWKRPALSPVDPIEPIEGDDLEPEPTVPGAPSR